MASPSRVGGGSVRERAKVASTRNSPSENSRSPGSSGVSRPTSDHGNVETTGCRAPQEGSVADLPGRRVRVFSDPALRARVAKRFPGALEWPANGLPENYLALLAPARRSFVRESERPVAHGGVTLEEVVVPFVVSERSGSTTVAASAGPEEAVERTVGIGRK